MQCADIRGDADVRDIDEDDGDARLEGLDAVSQLALILGSTRIPLAVVSPTLAAREVVEALPWEVAGALASRERRGTMHWWRRHAKR